MTRTGKIARLPRAVRDELNCRLLEGEPGIRLVEWLNSHAEVQAVLKEAFSGRPISEQNLSEWKQGGYEDWRRHQESVEVTSRMLEETVDYETLAEDGLLSDRLAELAAVSLGRELRAAAQLEEGPEKRQAVLAVVRELVHLRRTDRAYERSIREEDIHERRTEDYWAEKKREVERSVEFEINRTGAYYHLARTMKAEHEAKGQPVPTNVTELLATEEEFKVACKSWIKRCESLRPDLR